MVSHPELEKQVSNQDSIIDDLNVSQEEEDNGDQPYEKDKLIYNPDQINIFTQEPTIELLLRRINEETLDLAPRVNASKLI